MSDMENNEMFELQTAPEEVTPVKTWAIDLNREEFVAFQMRMARYFGPLRQRVPTLLVSAICCLMMSGYAVGEWLAGGMTGQPDMVLITGAALMLIPVLFVCLYVPYRVRRNAQKQYDRSVEAGMDYYGLLTVYPDCIEKVSQTTTGHVRLDERTLFIEAEDMMIVTAMGSPAIVLPARCLTEEMADAVRGAMDRIPTRNRRFVARIRPQGETPAAPVPKEKPEELWVTTFTYTNEEYATVLKGLIQQNFWRLAPLLAVVSMMGAFAFGYNGESLIPCIWIFLAFIGVMILTNLVMPLLRVKRQAETLSPHDLTMQVRLDTIALRTKLPKGGENWVLWCDVDHVYERDTFIEVVHHKRGSLFIPKWCIPDLNEFDAIIQRCKSTL